MFTSTKLNHVKPMTICYSIRFVFCHFVKLENQSGKKHERCAKVFALPIFSSSLAFCSASLYLLLTLPASLSLADAVLSKQANTAMKRIEKKKTEILTKKITQAESDQKKCFKIALISTLVWQSTMLIISIRVSKSLNRENTGDSYSG